MLFQFHCPVLTHPHFADSSQPHYSCSLDTIICGRESFYRPPAQQKEQGQLYRHMILAAEQTSSHAGSFDMRAIGIYTQETGTCQETKSEVEQTCWQSWGRESDRDL